MKQRNAHVDYIRGIAILLVMLGHTVSNNGMNDFADSGMYKVIFALQMPLFMLVSGYVTKYSRPIFSLLYQKAASRPSKPQKRR